MTAAPPGPELDTLLRLVSPVDEPIRPWAALSWAPVGSSGAELLRHVLRRSSTAVAARVAAATSRSGMTIVRPMRGSLRPGWRDRLRRRAGSGYVAYRPDGGSLVSHILEAAGGVAISVPAVGADGAVRLRVRHGDGHGLLRMGVAGSPADPSWAAAGLAMLASHGYRRVPRVLGAGRSADVEWVLEELLPGRRPIALTPPLTDVAAAFLAALPRSGDTPPVGDDAAVIAAAAPACATAVRRAADAVAGSAPAGLAQMRHGDLWTGNLLIEGSELTGIVDWDSWSPAGLPGVDLLHLVATERRIRSRSALGEVWLDRPWEEEDFTGAVRRHWPEWGGDAEARRLVGVAWWLGQLAGDLRRNPALGQDDRWVARNVTAVAEVL